MAAPPTPKHKPEPHFKPDRMQKPTGALPVWPRPGTRGRKHVGGADTWGNVALAWGVPDVWDLIAWNFGTPATPEPTPRQVNWYMHHYIGCWRATADGKNFRFIEADPGWIQFPPFGWSRKVPGLPFHTTVALSLRRLVPAYPFLDFMGFKVKPIDVHHVAAALHDGRLGAKVDTGLASLAEYNDDTLVFSTPSISSFDAKLTIVHEITHAIIDRKYAGLGMRRWEGEVIAYTTEALWARATDNAEAEAMLARADVSGSSKAALVLARYMRAAGSGPLRVKDFDTTLPDYRQAGRTLNPVRELRKAIWKDIVLLGDGDPRDLMLLDGWD